MQTNNASTYEQKEALRKFLLSEFNELKTKIVNEKKIILLADNINEDTRLLHYSLKRLEIVNSKKPLITYLVVTFWICLSLSVLAILLVGLLSKKK